MEARQPRDCDHHHKTYRLSGHGGPAAGEGHKTHQQRRVVLDPPTTEVLLERRARAEARARALGTSLAPDCYVFSSDPESRMPTSPDAVTQRYKRMANSLGIETTLKSLRHYTATELISAVVDVRTVAGRLGHGGGGATTLRVYTAWTSEADQRAAHVVSGRMPVRSVSGSAADQAVNAPMPSVDDTHDDSLYQKTARDRRGAIESGILLTRRSPSGREGSRGKI